MINFSHRRVKGKKIADIHGNLGENLLQDVRDT